MVDIANIVENQWILYYRQKDFAGDADKKVYIDNIAQGVKQEGFAVDTSVAFKHSNALLAVYSGTLTSDQIRALNLEKYNIIKQEPVALHRADKR